MAEKLARCEWCQGTFFIEEYAKRAGFVVLTDEEADEMAGDAHMARTAIKAYRKFSDEKYLNAAMDALTQIVEVLRTKSVKEWAKTLAGDLVAAGEGDADAYAISTAEDIKRGFVELEEIVKQAEKQAHINLCPLCKSKCTLWDTKDRRNFHWIECDNDNCFYETPNYSTDAEAIAAHNAVKDKI